MEGRYNEKVPKALLALLRSSSGDLGPDVSFYMSASLEYLSGLACASLAEETEGNKKYHFVVANAKFILDEEHFHEHLFKRVYLFKEKNMEHYFLLVIKPKFLDKIPNITKRLKRHAVSLVSTNGTWIKYASTLIRNEWDTKVNFLVCMRTRSSSNLPVESSPNPSTSNPKLRNRRRSKQPFILEESPIDMMADQRTMVELLRAPTEGYAEEHVAIQRETKARTLLLQSLPEDHMADFHHLDDAREIWLAVKARFGGNEESKRMRKTMLKQKFSEFSVSEEEGLHKGYDRFQKILSQLNQMQAK
nr:ycf54-like protein [Tanacetum cinerariifolium]